MDSRASLSTSTSQDSTKTSFLLIAEATFEGLIAPLVLNWVRLLRFLVELLILLALLLSLRSLSSYLKRLPAKLLYSVAAIPFAGVLVRCDKYDFKGCPPRAIESVDKMAELIG